MLFCLAEAASILPSNVCPHEKQHSPYLLNSSNMASALDVFGRFQDQAIDFSRRNRLLRYPKTAHSIQFDGDSMNFRKKYMETGIEDLSVDFFHKDILRIEELEEIKQNGDGGSKRKKTADESEQKSMNPEEFTEEMEREFETLLQKVPECSPRGEKLIRALERFRLENKRKLEEHGLHTLFLAIGRVRWKQPMAGKRSSQNATDEYDYEAPLILLPVNLETKKRPEKHTELTLDSSQYDPQFNPVLSLMLEREYETKRIDAPEDSEGLLAKYKVLLKKVEEAFQEVKIKHEVEDGVWLRMYSFHGQQIFEDLRKNGQGMLPQSRCCKRTTPAKALWSLLTLRQLSKTCLSTCGTLHNSGIPPDGERENCKA